MQKKCRRCQETKSTNQFQKYSRNSDGLQPYCRPCKQLIDREHYERNPRRNYERNKAAAQRNRAWFYEYLKTKKCEWENCRIDDPDMLVLDHLNPAEKHLEVTCTRKIIPREWRESTKIKRGDSGYEKEAIYGRTDRWDFTRI